MELHLPLVLDKVAKNKVFALSSDWDHFAACRVSKKFRPPWWDVFCHFLKSRDRQCYVFDTGQDNSKEEIADFQKTADTLASQGLFHLPYRTVWIEDYFADNPAGIRLCYLCFQHEDVIGCWSLACDPEQDEISVIGTMKWIKEENMFGLIVRDEVTERFPDQYRIALDRSAMSTLMIQKFIGMLAASNTVRERKSHQRRELRLGASPGSKRGKDYKTIIYPYELLEAPPDHTVPPGPDGKQPVARHLVTGYVWGRNTRPVEQQKRIQPYWRGSGEEARRSHYEVRALSG